MMATRTKELSSTPGSIELYTKAALPMVPGLSRLPFVGGRGRDVPDLRLTQSDLAVSADRLAEYRQVCGFGAGDRLPATYPHILAFPLHMALLTDSSFPLAPIGLVHISNGITQHRPIDLGERLSIAVHATPLEPHPKGRQFSVVSEARVGGELVWEEVSTTLQRGGGDGESGGARRDRPEPPPTAEEWDLEGDLGRRYGGVSGDRNPIHIHPLTARLFGFPRAIAHGMWTKARCLAALEAELPESFTVEVSFKRPILLPARVEFGSETAAGGTRFAVRDAKKGTPHLEGTIERKGPS